MNKKVPFPYYNSMGLQRNSIVEYQFIVFSSRWVNGSLILGYPFCLHHVRWLGPKMICTELLSIIHFWPQRRIKKTTISQRCVAAVRMRTGHCGTWGVNYMLLMGSRKHP